MSVIGLSRLFINERFKQFSGLIDDCEWKRGDKEIKLEDLAGFWDMISYQIDDLKQKYNELDTLESNEWIVVEDEKLNNNNNVINNNNNTKYKSSLQVTNGGCKKAMKNGKTVHNNNNNKAVRSNFREFLKNRIANENNGDKKLNEHTATTNNGNDNNNGRDYSEFTLLVNEKRFVIE